MIYYGNELYHFGIPGQKWNRRRWQNEDGSYTPEGQSENNGHGRYSNTDSSNEKSTSSNKSYKSKSSVDYKKILTTGLKVGAAALAVYGGYKLYQNRDILKNYMSLGAKKVNSIKMKYFIDEIQNSDLKDINSVDDIKKLTESEVDALFKYTGDAHRYINNAADDMYRGRSNVLSKILYKNYANNISSAMKKVSLQKDIQVQRGFNKEAVKSIFGEDISNFIYNEKKSLTEKYGYNTDKIYIKDLASLKVLSHGFTSTSHYSNEETLEDYLNGPFSFSKEQGIIFHLDAKKGCRAICISPISTFSNENEILFDIGSNIESNGYIQIEHGVIHMFGEIVQS